MTDLTNDWPDDVDGDVFRRLQAHGFDFSKSYAIDYNVDFDSWPPKPEAVALLTAEFGHVVQYPPDEEMGGYIQFQVQGRVTYTGVMDIQRRVSAAMEPYGGICESWGVLQDAP